MIDTTAVTAYRRPEDRRRSDASAWADTLPAAFRSEAFAEDLDGPAEPAGRAAAALRAPRPAAWRPWRALAAR